MDKSEKLEFVRKVFWPKAKMNLWFELVEHFTQPQFGILEIGSGSGKGLQNQLYPNAANIYGLDLDERVLRNPHLNQAFNISAYDIKEKFEDVKFDIIYSHMVAEHISDANRFISTQLDCLKDSGTLIHSTVSKYYWTSLLNYIFPVSLKNWLIRKLGSGREADDIFPAYYELNSEKQIRKVCKNLHAYHKVIRQDEPPGYLRRSLILMFIYTMIHKPLGIIFPALRPTFIFLVSKEPFT
tara:strand:+ start:15354 stop:16073 length:720 start_codon:yes stop_codon:yes gene_type:complete